MAVQRKTVGWCSAQNVSEWALHLEQGCWCLQIPSHSLVFDSGVEVLSGMGLSLVKQQMRI